MTMKGGVGATLIAVFLAATFAGGVSLAGLTSTFTQAFDDLNLQSDIDFLDNFVASNVKAGCRTDNSYAKFPSNTNLSKQLGSVTALRIKQKNSLFGVGDSFLSLQVKTGGGKKNIRLDFRGAIGDSWSCQKKDDHGDKIFLNYSNYTNSPPNFGKVSKGNWLEVPQNSISKFRIIEEKPDKSDEGLAIQVSFVDG